MKVIMSVSDEGYSRTRTVKETSYTAIVRPTIEYAATVWDPTSQSKIKALKNIQEEPHALSPTITPTEHLVV
jgi:hypothetical protein